MTSAQFHSLFYLILMVCNAIMAELKGEEFNIHDVGTWVCFVVAMVCYWNVNKPK
jgi:hypothetical protein